MLKKLRRILACVLGMLFLAGYARAQEEPVSVCQEHMQQPQVECVGWLDVVPYSGTSDYVSAEEAVAEVREYLCQRETDFSVYVSVSSAGKLTESQIKAMALDTYYDAMEHTGAPTEGDYLLWHWKKLSYGYNGRYSGSSSGYTYSLTFTYGVDYRTTAQQEAQVDAAVDALLSRLALDGKTEYQKLLAIYDYMTNNIIYDYDGLASQADGNHYTAYGALVEGEAVCQGYASAFYRLALNAGVDARVISGDSSGPHGWNIVQLGELYYNLDSTWDAANPRYGTAASRKYFLKCPDDFANHTRDAQYDTAQFHAAYPMSPVSYEEGTELVQFDFAGTNMTLGNELAINFFIQKADLNGTTDNYAVVTLNRADGTVKEMTVPQADFRYYGTSTAIFGPSFDGIAAKEMGDSVTCVIYNAAGQAITGQRTESVKSYAMKLLASESYSVKQKTMAVDMLNYGAAAQTYFGYNAGSLVNADLTAEQKALATPEQTPANNQRTDLAYAGANLNLESQIQLTLFFNSSVVTADTYAIISYTSHTGEAVTKRVESSSYSSAFGASYNGIKLDTMVIADCGADITVTVYDAADDKVLTAAVDSVASYAARASGDLAALCKAIMCFSVGAYNSFH